MKRTTGLALCFLLVASFAAAEEAAVKTIAFDNLHIRVPDTAKAGAWYVKYLGATATESAHRVSFGRTLIVFSKGEPAGPSTVIDHIGVSYANLDAKLKELIDGGAKVLTPAEDRAGLVQDINQGATALKAKQFTFTREVGTVKVEGLDTGVAIVRDPDGVQIELLQRQKEAAAARD
jgi:catechol 2,3-dioxygenase-like lactoylglutathione lyase family enzyme